MQFVNNFRGIAILMVMMAHAVSAVPSNDSFLVYMLDVLLENSTLLFVAVAGYLFSFLSVNFNYVQFLKNKFYAVLVPYFFISIPAIMLFIFEYKQVHRWVDLAWLQQLNVFEQAGYLLVTGAHLGPLWFIPMIILFYLSSPLLLMINNKWTLPIAFFVSLVAAYYTGRPEFNENALESFVYFMPAYLLGMLLVKYKKIYETFSPFSLVLGLVWLAFIVMVSLSVEMTSSIDLLLKLGLTVLMLAFCKQYFDYKNRWLDMFARLSFFLFFIHGYFSGAIRVFYRVTHLEFEGLAAVLMSFVIITLASLSVFVVLKLMFSHHTKRFIGV
ncbi:acyltransferase [Catenovulum sp. 2E275]|uniref:acyltransferase family protein n=1 Tax=Catenovulum sp. 2E275 TaxID=2980497 RepID=UPI0021CEE5EB|nr:acyltransferase [Catenovulum sp. 2E275]MCU4674823.1 acyltransferase [Catenovulum sp. 2E275]